MNCLISIIVPIFNSETYLSRCIDSILTQTFSDFEVILIDDGSSDASGSICDNYALKDTRVRVYHKENGGVSSARNLGLEKAKGEWIVFVDSDDVLLYNSLNILFEKVRGNDVDLVICGYTIYDECGIHVFSTEYDCQDKLISANEGIKLMFKGAFYNGYLWNKLFKRKIIVENKLFFDEKIYYNEDRLFCIQYMSCLKYKIYYSTDPTYVYMRHSNSAMACFKNDFNLKVVTELDAYIKMYIILCANGTRYNKNLVKEGIVGSYLRLKKILRCTNNFDQKEKYFLKANMRNKVFQAISIGDYYLILMIFLVRAVKRRLMINL